MRVIPKKHTGIIIGGIAGILVLALIAAVIIYFINREKDVTPDDITATSCCSCTWALEFAPNELTPITEAVGVVTNGLCSFANPEATLGDFTPTTCADIDIADVFEEIPDGFEEDDIIAGTENRGLCDGGCVFHTSDPLLPPSTITEENNAVTFTSYFELRYAIEPHTEYTEAEMNISYPNDTSSPEPIETTTFELISTRDEEGSEAGTLPIKLYKATFDTTWDTVLDPDTPGIYTVSFRAKDNSPEENWTSTGNCGREFEVTHAIEEGEYCYGLDAVPVSGTSPYDVTLTVDGGIPEGDTTAVYEWHLDLNCNGTIDEGTGENAETFTTPSTANSITRTFTLGEGDTQATCSAEVAIKVEDGTRTLFELSPGSCSSSVSITKSTEETCGNGECDTDELCDPDGNIACPAGGLLSAGLVCRDDCTYCGDGTLDDEEDCDPGINEGETGYDAECQANCTIDDGGTEDGTEVCGDGVLDQGEACDPGITEGQTGYNANCQSDCTIGEIGPITNALTITQHVPQCTELVSPNNISQISITITNGTISAVEINAISDTLPQGFAYATGSSTIDGVPNTSDTGLTLESSGNSQLLTWDNSGSGWTLNAGQSLTLAFSSFAGGNATIGAQPNTVTVTPADTDPIPNQTNITVAQVCTQPLTGIFSRNVVIILGGLLLLFLSGTAYYYGWGTRSVATLMHTGSSQVRLLYLRLSQPQKFAEEQIQKAALKNIKSRTNGRTPSSRKGQKQHP